jgi:hypothetical protein
MPTRPHSTNLQPTIFSLNTHTHTHTHKKQKQNSHCTITCSPLHVLSLSTGISSFPILVTSSHSLHSVQFRPQFIEYRNMSAPIALCVNIKSPELSSASVNAVLS